MNIGRHEIKVIKSIYRGYIYIYERKEMLLVNGYIFCRLLSDAAARIENLVRSGKSRQEAWDASTVVLTWAAKVV